MAGVRINLNDATWLRIESAETPMHVGIMATFVKPDDAGESYLTDVVERMREVRTFAPPFNYVLKGSALPRWEPIPDEAVDLDYHFRHSALPGPGGERELGMLISRLHTSRLNRHYPLWELHVIEGLPDRRWAMYFKVHHSQFDGMAGIRMLRRMLSVDPAARGMLPPWAIGTTGPDQSGLPRAERPPRTPEPSSGSRRASVRAVAGALGRTYRSSVLGTDGVRAVPFQAPRSVFNARVDSPRRFATQHYEMERLRRVATAAGASINDVFLAVSGAAVRRYLLELDALPERDLTATVPVAVSSAGQAGGNAITFLYTYLGTHLEHPKERLEFIQASTRAGKDALPAVGRTAMDAFTIGVAAPAIGQGMTGIAAARRPVTNLVISNVPGPAEDRYYDGSLMEIFHPVSLVLHGQALNITGVSYRGGFGIGYTGCRSAVPHLQRIAVYSGEALAELEAAYGVAE